MIDVAPVEVLCTSEKVELIAKDAVLVDSEDVEKKFDGGDEDEHRDKCSLRQSETVMSSAVHSIFDLLLSIFYFFRGAKKMWGA